MPEIKDLSESSENLSSKKFSPETKGVLEKEGYLIYTLTGKSIDDIKKEGMMFWCNKDLKEDPLFNALSSRQSEIAINLNQFFLPDSNNKTLDQQEDMVENFSRELSSQIKGIKAIIGEASDYIELAFNHQIKSGEKLFLKYPYYKFRTKTPRDDSHVVCIGGFSNVGMDIDIYSNKNSPFQEDETYIAPFIVPT